MLQWKSEHPWDTLRLIDFGFAQRFETGTLPMSENLRFLCSCCLCCCHVARLPTLLTSLIVLFAFEVVHGCFW